MWRLPLLTVYKLPGFAVRCIVACLLLVVYSNVQGQTDSTAAANQPAANNQAYPDSITTFDQLDMPMEMATEFRTLQPNAALLYRDEFQQMHDGLYGQSIRTIKVWYIDDHIIGYILERPFDAGSGPRLRKQKINIPVNWCCTPTVEGHEVHCANSLEDLRGTTAASKCTGWHIQLPEQYMPVQRIKLAKKPAPQEGDFGHSKKTDNRSKKKKKGDKGFDQYNEQEPAQQPAVDSTQAKPF